MVRVASTIGRVAEDHLHHALLELFALIDKTFHPSLPLLIDLTAVTRVRSLLVVVRVLAGIGGRSEPARTDGPTSSRPLFSRKGVAERLVFEGDGILLLQIPELAADCLEIRKEGVVCSESGVSAQKWWIILVGMLTPALGPRRRLRRRICANRI